MIYALLDVFTIAFSGVVLSMLYDDLLDEDMLLERLGLWLRDGTFWKKPIGGCVQCACIWITIAMYFVHLHLYMVWLPLTILGSANLILKLLYKLD